MAAGTKNPYKTQNSLPHGSEFTSPEALGQGRGGDPSCLFQLPVAAGHPGPFPKPSYRHPGLGLKVEPSPVSPHLNCWQRPSFW